MPLLAKPLRGASRAVCAVAVGLLASLVLGVAVASADVLVNDPGSSVSCRAGIRTGVFYQAFSGGPRRATITIRSAAGTIVFSRSVIATGRWHYFRYHGRCGRRYRVIYEVAGRTTTFAVRIRLR
jgi:hypothetical protein